VSLRASSTRLLQPGCGFYVNHATTRVLCSGRDGSCRSLEVAPWSYTLINFVLDLALSRQCHVLIRLCGLSHGISRLSRDGSSQNCQTRSDQARTPTPASHAAECRALSGTPELQPCRGHPGLCHENPVACDVVAPFCPVRNGTVMPRKCQRLSSYKVADPTVPDQQTALPNIRPLCVHTSIRRREGVLRWSRGAPLDLHTDCAQPGTSPQTKAGDPELR